MDFQTFLHKWLKVVQSNFIPSSLAAPVVETEADRRTLRRVRHLSEPAAMNAPDHLLGRGGVSGRRPTTVWQKAPPKPTNPS